MQQKRLTYLLEQYGVDQATPEELAELHNYLQSSGSGEAFEEAGYTLLSASGATQPGDTAAYRELLQHITAIDVPPTSAAVVFRWRTWLSVAAVALLVITGAVLWNKLTKPAPATLARHTSVEDIDPGREGAVLTLADGRQVVLDSLGNGVIATQDGTSVVLTNGQLLYNAAGGAGTATLYNTMSTPKGRQFQITLPDGTRVWLNSASSIRFPTVFNGKERKVDVTGEVYFEVAALAAAPFKVSVADKAEIEVLGTHFNVNAYDNEKTVNTTLLEGAVRVSRQQQQVVLQPGQQAQLTTQRMQVLDNADIGKVMAWKNGLFNFDGASLEEVMRQLERWYDIEVVYENGVPPIQFFGKMSKDLTLAQLLEALKSFDVHFTMEEGKKLVITR